MKLVIVESPAKCKKIENYLGNGYKCVASFGHISGIINGLKDVNLDNFKVKYSPLKNKGLTNLRKQINKADEVILATDDDREGEGIAWHICITFNLPIATTKRIIFNEITKPALQYAINNPVTVNINKVYAQQTRQVLDLIVGFTISPILWKYISRKMQLSAGRCQTPALRIIYDNDILIKDNPGTIMFKTILYYNKLQFKLDTYFEEEESLEKFLKESIDFKHMLYSGMVCSNVMKSPPLPLTTSSLQQKASNLLGYSPKKTMMEAQKLYEAGHITYMRTDSKKYSEKFIEEGHKYISKTYGAKAVMAKKKETKKKETKKKETKKKAKDNAQEAHEAIRPTDITAIVESNSLYNLIRSITLESLMTPANYKSICGFITGPSKKYKCMEEQVVEPGWKVVRGYIKENPAFTYLEEQGERKTHIKYEYIKSEPQLKDKKIHLNEAKLVQTLEKKGIGRPSTFSNIISKIQERGYVEKKDVPGKKIKNNSFLLKNGKITKEFKETEFGIERNKLVLQDTGKIVIEFLINHFDPLFVYNYTKNMEDNLDEIAKGKKKLKEVCRECYDEINILTNKIKESDKEEYRIDEEHLYMIGKYGPVIKKTVKDVTTFISVKKDIDVQKIKNGEYNLEDIMDVTTNFEILGKHKNSDVILKKGKFGRYIEYKTKNYSIRHIKKKNLKLDDILGVLNTTKTSNVLFEINKEISIRKGNYGEYIYYKTEKMKKPKFLNLKKKQWRDIPKDELHVWIKDEYNI